MWTWFKDWAQIARTLVTDKRYRYYMGISDRSPNGNGKPDASDLDALEPEILGPAPTPAGPGVPVPV